MRRVTHCGTPQSVFPGFFKYSPNITLNYRVDFDLAGRLKVLAIEAQTVCGRRQKSRPGEQDRVGKLELGGGPGERKPISDLENITVLADEFIFTVPQASL